MNTKLLTGTGMALALGACASMPQPNAQLQNAEAAVHAAEIDPNVNKYAALDLEKARKYLAQAEDAAQHHRDADVDQPAYLATETAQIAEERAAGKVDDARVAAGQVERDQIMLAERTREANNAKMAEANAQQQAAMAQEQTAQAQAELAALKAKPTPRGLVLTLGDVLFDTSKAELNSGASRKMDQLAQFLKDHPERRVQIDGFTDSVGTDSYNEDLSQRRADSVKNALLARGIDSSRIGTEGYGKSYPVASNSESAGRQMNRRVEVVIGDDNGTAIAPRSGL